MAIKLHGLAAMAAMTFTACEPATESPPPPPPMEASGEALLDQQADAQKVEIQAAQAEDENIAEASTARINWRKAREDFAAQSGSEEPLVSIANAGETPPPVPVLLPTGGPVSVAGDGGPRFKQTADGYYAVYKYENYDVIVNGTNEVIGDRDRRRRGNDLIFTATAAGAQVALSRYGADYLVEFECYVINPATGTCIEEAEAMGVAESLVIRGTR